MTNNLNNLRSICKAVQQEYQAVKDIPSTLTLFEGQFIGNDEDDFHIYQFEIPPEKVAPDTDEIEIFIDNRKLEGKVLEVLGQFIHIALAVDERKVIDKLTLKWESGFLLKKLMERIENIGKNSNNYNLNLAEDLISPTSSNSQSNDAPGIELILPSTIDKGKKAKLNPSQEQAIIMSLKNRLTFVWGPPGTGKTTVLGGVVYNLYRAGYKVLLASNTNRAVDVALSKVISAFEKAESIPNKQKLSEFLKGKIVRYGNMVLYEDEVLSTLHFSRYVEEELKKRNSEIEPLKILLKQYLKAKQEVVQYNDWQKKLLEIQQKIEQQKIKLQQIEKEKSDLKQQLEDIKTAGLLKSLWNFLNDVTPEKIQERLHQINQLKIKTRLDLENFLKEQKIIQKNSPPFLQFKLKVYQSLETKSTVIGRN